MTQWYDQRQQEIERRKQALLQQLNKPRIQPDDQAARDYYAKIAQQQKQQTVKQDTSKKKGLLDSLMKQRGGIWGSLQNKAKDLSNAWSDNGGFDLGDIGDTFGMFSGTKPGDVFKGASNVVNSAKPMMENLNNKLNELNKQDIAGNYSEFIAAEQKKQSTEELRIDFKENNDFASKSAQNFAAGAGDVVKGVGQAMTWVGAKNPQQGILDKMGKSLTETGTNIAEKYESPYEKEFTWGALLDPDFYATSGARGLPFMLSMIAPSIGGGAVGLGLSNAALRIGKLKNLGNFGKTVVRGLGAGTGGHLATGPMEAAIEAGSVYDEALKKGLSPEEADQAADATFWQNEALLAASQIPGFATMFAPLFKNAVTPAAKTFLQKVAGGAAVIGGNAALEGGQEVGQTFIAANQLGNEVSTAEWQEALALGGLMGGGMTAIQQINPMNRPKATPPPGGPTPGPQPTNQQSTTQQPNQQQAPQPESFTDWNEQQRQHASQVLGGADPIVVVRNDVRPRLSEELNGELDFIREQLEAQGHTGEDLEQKLDDYIDSTEEGHRHTVEATERLNERLKQPSSAQPLQPNVPLEVEQEVMAQEAMAQTAQPQATPVEQQTAQPIVLSNGQDISTLTLPELKAVADSYTDRIVKNGEKLSEEEFSDSLKVTNLYNKLNENQPTEEQQAPTEQQAPEIKSSIFQRMKDRFTNRNQEPQSLEEAVQQQNAAVDQVANQADQMQAQVMGSQSSYKPGDKVVWGKEERTVTNVNQAGMLQLDNGQVVSPTVVAPSQQPQNLQQELADAMLNATVTTAKNQIQQEQQAAKQKTEAELLEAALNAGTKKEYDQAQKELEGFYANRENKEFQPNDIVQHTSTGLTATYNGETHPNNENLVKVTLSNGKEQYWGKSKMKPAQALTNDTFEPVEFVDDSTELSQEEDVEEVEKAEQNDRAGELYPVGSKVTLKGLSAEFEVVKNHDNSMLTVKGPNGNELNVGRGAVTSGAVTPVSEPLIVHNEPGTRSGERERESQSIVLPSEEFIQDAEAKLEAAKATEAPKDDGPTAQMVADFINQSKNIKTDSEIATSPSVLKAWGAIDLFRAGKIDELISKHGESTIFRAGNNGYYSEPFQHFTGVKLPWEANSKKEREDVKKMLEEAHQARSEKPKETKAEKAEVEKETTKNTFELGDIVTSTYEWNDGEPKQVTGFVVETGKKQLRVEFPNKVLGSNSLWFEVEKTKPATLEDLEKAFAKAEKEFSPSSHEKTKKEAEKKLKNYRKRLDELQEEEDADPDVGPKPSKNSDDYQIYKNGDYVEFVDHEGNVKRGYVKGHAWHGDKPGTQRPADTIRIEHEFEFNKNKAVHSLVDPDKTEITILENRPEQLSAEEFVKDRYRARQDIDPNQVIERLKEAGYGDIPIGQILKWKVDVGPKASAVKKDDVIQKFAESYKGSVSKRQEIMNEFRKAHKDHAKIRKDLKLGAQEFTDHLIAEVEKVRSKANAERVKKEAAEKNSKHAEKAKQFEVGEKVLYNLRGYLQEGTIKRFYTAQNGDIRVEIKDETHTETSWGEDVSIDDVQKFEEGKSIKKNYERFKVNSVIQFHSQKYNKRMYGKILENAGSLEKLIVLYTDETGTGHAIDDDGKPIAGKSEHVSYNLVIQDKPKQEKPETIPAHSLEDRKYMSLSPNKADIEAIKKEQPPNILLAYDKWGKVKKKSGGFNDRKSDSKHTVSKLMKEIGYRPESVILDSGAFAFWDQGDPNKKQIMDDIYGPVEEAFYERYWEFDREEIKVIVDDEIQRAWYHVGNKDMMDESNEDGAWENGDSIASSPDDMNEFLKYYQWAQANADDKTYIMSFDKVGDPDTSWDTYNALAGLFENVIPTYHYGSDESYLDRYVKDGAKYIALGGSVNVPMIQRIEWAKGITEKYPNVKFHMLGTMSQELMDGVPGLYSLDGSGWVDKSESDKTKTKEENREIKAQKSADNIKKIMGKGDLKPGDFVTHTDTNWTGKFLGYANDKNWYNGETVASVDGATGQQYWELSKTKKETNIVTTHAGTQVPVKYEIVEAHTLIASHNVMGMTNKEYPKRIQPRDRSAVDSVEQIAEMARTLDPLRLGESRMASDGAPIVAYYDVGMKKPGLVVESGNGRTMAIMKMYSDMKRNNGYNPVEQEYARFLKQFAKDHKIDVDVDNMNQPILVRNRLNRMTAGAVEKFVAEANESGVSKMGATETALADAKAMNPFIHLFVPSESGEINTAQNQEFIKKYINEVVPSSDRREVRTKEGYLSQDGKERLERALFALAYPDDTAIARYSEDLDDSARTVTGAMTDVAAKMAVLNADVKAGTILPEFAISQDIVEAFNKLVELRRKGYTGKDKNGKDKLEQWIEEDKAQVSMFEETQLSDTVYELLGQFNQLKSRNKIRALLANYVEYVLNDPRSQGEDMFGDRATKEEFLQIAIERMNGGGDLLKLETQTRPSETKNDGKKPGTQAGKTNSGEETKRKVVNPLPEEPIKVAGWKLISEYSKVIGEVISTFQKHIQDKTLPTGKGVQKDLRKIASDIFGRAAQEDEWSDALEAAIQLEYYRIKKENPNMTLQEKIKLGKELETLLKTAGRSMEKTERQQFSTPLPLAEIVGMVANPQFYTEARENSAGTGSLALAVLDNVKDIVVNDLSPRRAAILSYVAQTVGKGKIQHSNLNAFDVTTREEKPHLIIGNPPFKGQNKGGGTAQFNGNPPWKGGWGDLGNRFLNWDLRMLQDGGRLVYIVSGGVIDNAQNREFRNWLKKEHSVLAMVKFPSGVYDTRGTKFPTGLIVVEKGKAKQDFKPIIGEFETLESLLRALIPISAKTQIPVDQLKAGDVVYYEIQNKLVNRPLPEVGQVENVEDGWIGLYMLDKEGRRTGFRRITVATPVYKYPIEIEGVLPIDEPKQKPSSEIDDDYDNYGDEGDEVDSGIRVPTKKSAPKPASTKTNFTDLLNNTNNPYQEGDIVLFRGEEWEVVGAYHLGALDLKRGKKTEGTHDKNVQLVRKKGEQKVPENVQPNKYDKMRSRLDRIEANARKYIDENGKGRMNSLPLDLYTAVAIIGAKKIADGVVDFAEWSEQMLTEFGPKIRLSLRSLYVQAEDITQFSDDDWDEYLENNGMTEINDKNQTEEAAEETKSIEIFDEDENVVTLGVVRTLPNDTTYTYKTISDNKGEGWNVTLSKSLGQRVYKSKDNPEIVEPTTSHQAFYPEGLWYSAIPVTEFEKLLNGEPFNVYFEDENSADSTVKKMEKRIAERKILDEVAPNKGKGNTGTGNTGENASVGRPGKSASSGSKKDGPRQSDGSRGKSGGTGAEHTELSNTNLDGKSNPRPSESKQEQEDVFNPLPEDVELLDRGQSGRTKSNGTNRPANSNQSSDTRYVPRVTVTNTAHRGNVTEAPNMRFVSLPDEIFEGDTYLPHPKVIKGGKYKLSDVQIETIMAAKYNFEMGKRGMLIADDTGMGKTAQQLGIAADAFYSGRTKRILIVTTKDQVATVNFPRDNKMLGLDLPITWMHKDNKEYTKQHGYNWKDYHFNGKPTKKGGKPPAEYKPFQVGDGVIIMSKDTFRDAKESVIKWLEGAEGDVTIIIDESHEFANGEAGRGKANKLIYNHFKDKAQWIYASATAAENIDGLEHMYGLQKWSTDGFGTFKLRLTSADVKATAGKKQTGMSASFAKNGNSPFQREIPLTMMEQITRELKLDGQYLGRALSMEGVSMDGLPIKISPEEEGDWNRAVQFIRMIAEKAEMYGRKKNGDLNPKQRGQIASQVVGYMRRISGYYRMKAVIEDIKEQMKSGEFERFGIIGEFVKGDDGRPANLFAAINVINTQDPIDTGDDVVYEDIPEAIADKEYLLAILRGENPEWGEYPVPIIPTPMSLLYDAFGEENVAIVSGEVDGKDRPKVVEEFQNMKKQIIWFNSAGGTGVDMHDTVGTPIRVYTQDYAYTAKAQKQAEGRFHRTGQVTAPTFVYPYLNSSTDTKFVGTLIARYEAMGALSRGDVGKLGGESLSDFDMTGEAAEIASVRIIPELDEEVRVQMFGEFTRDTNFISDFNGGLDETAAASVYSGNEPEVKKFLNALMFLDYKASSRVFAQFTEKIKEVEKELAEKGGVKDKFETYKGKELEVQVGKTGIKLRKIKTILTDAQKRKLDYDLEMAVKNEAAMEEEYIKTEQETLSKYEKQVDEINAKQIETKLREDEAREAYRKLRSDLTAKPEDVGKAYNKYNAIVNEFNRRKERLDEVKTKLKGLKDGNEDVILTIADMKRAQTRKKNAKLTRMGAQANIERSQDILLIDGKIATNGLLVNIRQAIREAARRVYGEKNTPASALTLELRGYVLENGEKALGAVVPKWAEAEVAKSLEARMSYQGNANDLEELKAFVEAGNKVSLQGGYELEYKSGPAKIIINGMTVAKDKDLFKSINDGEKHLGFHPVARAFSVDTTEGMKRLLERFPIMEKKVSKENQPEQPKSPTPPGTRKVLGYAVEVKTDKHTQTGEDIWLIKPIDNVPKEKWAQLAGHMKKHGGSYYGKFTKGPLRQFMGNFVFQKNPADVFDTESTPSNAEEVNTFIPSRNSSSAAPSSTEETVTRSQIINHVRKEFNVPIGTGRYRNRAKGLYKKVVNEIRMKNFADFVVLAHELGHQLDNKFKLVQDHNRDELIDLAMSNLMIPNRMSEEEVAAEGVAEFVRLYLYNRPAIMGMDFYREFSERMEEEGKLEALETLTTMLDTWTGQSAEARVDGVTDVRQKRKKMKNPKQKAKDLYADWVEELIGLKRATDKLKGNRTLEGREDPYMLAWRTRGTSGKIQAFLEHGIIDEETGTKIAPSFKEIIESVPEIQKLRRYLEAKHALTLHGEGKYKTPITETDANGIISRLDGESSTYSEAAENLYEYQDYVTRELVASGILKENTVDEWNDKYPFYVPFYRVMEEAGEREGESKGNGSRRHQFANSANPVKKMKDTGSAKNLVDPLESIMKNTFMYLNLAQRNDVGTALTDLLGEDSAEVMVEVDPKQYATLFNLDEVKKDILTVLNDSGMSLTNDDIDFDKMSKVFRPFIAPSMTENIVTVWKNGERKMYEVRDEELYRALTAMDNETIWEWIKLMAIPNNILRTGITLSPTFIPRGPIRSVMTLMQQSSSYTTPMDYMRLFPDLFMGAVSSVKKDDSFWDWMSAGGAQSTLLSIEREYFKDAKNRILFKPATKEVLKQAVLSVGTVPIYKGLRYVSQMFDEAVRIAEYKQARRKGADRVEAAIRSRDVDADFSKFGRSSKNINRMDLFFNIAIQGPDRFIREMKAHPVRSLVRGFSLITLPTMALMALNYDDENYWELEQWERDLFWNIPIGDGKFFKIPIPFEWGFAFKAIPERLVQGWARDDRTAFEGFFKSMAMSMLPTIVPTLFIPWIEFMAEKDWGTWRSTTRPYDNRPAEEQTNDHTTEMAKWLGGLIDQPPTKIDQFANSFAGTFGSMAMTGAGLFIPNEYGEKPSSDKGFFERSFIADSADGNTFSTTKFYDNKDKMEKEHSENGVKGEPNDDLRIARDAETYLSQLRKLRTLVRTDKTKSGTEKGDHITKINSAIRDISRLALGKEPFDSENMKFYANYARENKDFEHEE